jgi:type I restriction enzyme, S subunit
MEVMEPSAKYLARPGYKQTEVGVIPEDWDVVLLDSVAKRGSGHTPDKAHPEYWGGTIKWVSLQDSDRLDRLYIWDTSAKITPAGIANSSAKMHPLGTVVLSRDAGVGKSAIMKDDMAVSQHFMAWTCGPSLNNHFLYYWLQSNKFEFERIAMGNTIKTIGLPYFRRLAVPLPTKAEQEAVAKALSDADALIESLEQVLAKKRQLKQGAMQDLLTGMKRLPGFSGKWEVKRLGELAEIVMGQSPSSAHYNARGDGLPLIQGNADIFDRRTIKRFFTTEVTKRGRSGDILMSVRAPVGEISRAVFDVCLGRGVCAIRYPNDFLYYALIAKEPTWAKLSKGSTFDSVNSMDVKVLEIEVPADKIEQTAIATVLSEMDAEIAGFEAKLAKTRQLKQGMVQELLTGRIRLV